MQSRSQKQKSEKRSYNAQNRPRNSDGTFYELYSS